MGRRFPAAALAAAVRPFARSSPAASKAAKPTTAPLDTPRNAGSGAAAGASSGRAEVRDVAAACGCRRTTGCRSRRWFWTARSGGSRTRSRRRAPETPPCRSSSARCTAAATASTRTSTSLEFGWRKHQDIGLQSGKFAINAQDTMPVIPIQMMLRKQPNNGYFRVMGLLAGACRDSKASKGAQTIQICSCIRKYYLGPHLFAQTVFCFRFLFKVFVMHSSSGNVAFPEPS
ncbi:hypothetical protein ZWY2020_034218 [Hordeum vulgare]|nr:hypothetical protein ZWY2020_034218 [Hordeum vulgare]